MSENFEKWAITERTFIQEDIYWLRAGGKVLSPSGEDVTADRLKSLAARLEYANKVISELDEARRT